MLILVDSNLESSEIEEGEIVSAPLESGLAELEAIVDDEERIKAMIKYFKDIADRLDSLSPSSRACFHTLVEFLSSIDTSEEMSTRRTCMFLGESGEGKSFILNLLLLLSLNASKKESFEEEDLAVYQDHPELRAGTQLLLKMNWLLMTYYFNSSPHLCRRKFSFQRCP